MTNDLDRSRALRDFDLARQEAALGDLLARVRGRPSELLAFDEIRARFQGIQKADQKLQDIPVAAIVGSVGRYNDFNRDFLPRAAHDRERWAGVQAAMDAATGLPPIQVYQVGEAYFVIDGNHRVSITRRRGYPTIQAYVTEIHTRVGISPDDNPAEILLKAEYNDFLEQTRLDEICPGVNFQTTEPGAHFRLLEEIEQVGREAAEGAGKAPDIPQAAARWYEMRYLPVVDILHEQNLIRRYPNRTETDLYVWLLENHRALAEELDWDLRLDVVAENLGERTWSLKRMQTRLREALDPDSLAGTWRSKQLDRRRGRLFSDIVVWIESGRGGSVALIQAVEAARIEGAHLLGVLHLSGEAPKAEEGMRAQFMARCREAGIEGQLTITQSAAAEVLPSRSRWADLVVVPSPAPGESMEAGHHFLESLKVPVWLARGDLVNAGCLLLAFDGGTKSQEAMFMAAYLANLWGRSVRVVTVDEDGSGAEVLASAQEYLETYGVLAETILAEPPVPEAILHAVTRTSAGLLLTGSYHGHRFGRHGIGHTLDVLVHEASVPVLVCR